MGSIVRRRSRPEKNNFPHSYQKICFLNSVICWKLIWYQNPMWFLFSCDVHNVMLSHPRCGCMCARCELPILAFSSPMGMASIFSWSLYLGSTFWANHRISRGLLRRRTSGLCLGTRKSELWVISMNLQEAALPYHFSTPVYSLNLILWLPWDQGKIVTISNKNTNK